MGGDVFNPCKVFDIVKGVRERKGLRPLPPLEEYNDKL